MKRFGRNDLSRIKMSEKEYLETHLKGIDEVKRGWYMNAMRNWAEEDYNAYSEYYLCVMGETSEGINAEKILSKMQEKKE
jgi:hypothetical protein